MEHETDEDFEENSEKDSYSVEVLDFKDWSLSKYYDYADISADFEDLEDLNRQIASARVALLKLSDIINKAERRARQAKTTYEREFRRKFIQSSERTATDKKISAEIQTEDLENKYLYYDQLANELRRGYFALKEELSSLQSVGNNMRQQIKIA